VANIVTSKSMPTGHKNQKTMHHTMDDGSIVIQHENDVSDIIEMNKFLQGEQSMHHRSEAFNHVASIDMLAAIAWCKDRGITKNAWALFMQDDKLIKEFCNDPDNKLWRTRLGKI
jgi:hypothetical protein